MTFSLEQLSARMRQGGDISLRETAQVALTLSIPSILQQLVVTAMEYIDAAMVGHIGAGATAAIGIVSSSTWLLNGILLGLSTAFSIQIAQYLGADRQADARGVLRQAMLFNLAAGLAAAGFGVGISGHLPGWLGRTPPCRPMPPPISPSGRLPSPHHRHGHVHGHAPRHRRCPDPQPDQRSGLRAGRGVQFLSHQPHSGADPLRPLRHGLGCRAGSSGRGAGHRPFHHHRRCADTGHPAAAGRPLCIRKPGSWKITRSCLVNLWRVGAPLAAERAALSSAQVLQVRIVSQLGTVAIAANSLGVSAEGLCYMAGYGIQDAAIALIGQAVGAHRKDMAKRFAWLCTGMGVGIMALSGVGLFAFAPALMGIFTADAAVIALGARVLRIEAFAEPMFGASIVASGAMQGPATAPPASC